MENETGTMPDSMFKVLSLEDEMAYRSWARDNYVKGDAVDSLWHPIIRSECGWINAGFTLQGCPRPSL
jgi:1,2-phenylacetyl-CoA epoxidase PaaB subunit